MKKTFVLCIKAQTQSGQRARGPLWGIKGQKDESDLSGISWAFGKTQCVMVAAALSGLFLTPPPTPPPSSVLPAALGDALQAKGLTAKKKHIYDFLQTLTLTYAPLHHPLPRCPPRPPPPYCFPFYITHRNTKACRRVRPSASGSVASGITVPLQAMEVLQKEKSADHCRITSEAILDALVRDLQATFFLDGEFELESNQRSGTLRDASKVHFTQTETEENKESCRSPDVQ